MLSRSIDRCLLPFAAALATSGCATASFSPPSTNLLNEMQVRGSNSSVLKSCRPYERTVGGDGEDKNDPIEIKRTADGAITLANNFIYEYRCASHSAGNSRQVFEVPGLLTGIGTATALALGAGSDVAIVGGATTALLDGAKDYYAPLAKAEIYDKALDAHICIKSTALGVKAFSTGSDKALGLSESLKDGTDVGYFSAERQFFELVSSALLNVERIAASRLRNSAKYDPAGLIAQIEKIAKEVEEKKEAAKKGALPPDPTDMTQVQKTAQAVVEDNPGTKTLLGNAKSDVVQTVAQAITKNDLLQSELQL